MLDVDIDVDKRFQEAVVFHKNGDLKSAKKIYLEILSENSSHVNTICNIGHIYRIEREYQKALQSFKDALSLDSKNITALNALASTYEEIGNFKEAIKIYKRVIKIDNNSIKAYNSIGVLLYKQARYKEASSIFELALKISPDDTQTLCNLGASYNRAKRYQDAKDVLEKALRVDINCTGAYVNLGNVYNKLNQHIDALACHNEALRFDPKSAINHANLAITYKHLGRYYDAIYSFDKAIELDNNFVNAHFDLATTYLLLGEYEKGFMEYEWRFKKPQMQALLKEHSYIFKKPKFTQNSETKDRTLLLFSEQGFGDIIQFIRFIEPLKKRYPDIKIKLHCRRELKTLLEGLEYIDEVVSRDEDVGEFDYHLSIMSLAHFLNITLKTLPQKSPYIEVDGKSRRLYLSKDRLNIGIVWGASRSGESYDDKVFSLAWFKPLMKRDDVKLYSLQVGDDSKEIESLGFSEADIVDLEDRLESFKDTALVINELDLVITSDTSVAHLCGALGKEVWILLQKQADWRWGRDSKTTPWYSSARLFRQQQKGDWADVFSDVMVALDKRVK